MYQSRRAGDEAKKRKSPAKRGRVRITVTIKHRLQPMDLCILVRSFKRTKKRRGLCVYLRGLIPRTQLKVKSASKYIIVSYTSLQFKISFALFWFLIYLSSFKTP